MLRATYYNGCYFSQIPTAFPLQPSFTFPESKFPFPIENRSNIGEKQVSNKLTTRIKVLEVSKISDVSEVSEVAKVSEVSEVAKVSEVSEVAKVSKVSEVSEVAKVSKVSEVSEVAKVSEVSEVLGLIKAISVGPPATVGCLFIELFNNIYLPYSYD